MSNAKDTSYCERINLNDIKTLQPFGVLIVVNQKSLKIHSISSNCKNVLGVATTHVLGKKLENFLCASSVKYLRSIVKAKSSYMSFFEGVFTGDPKLQQQVTIAAYLDERYLYLELEQYADDYVMNYLSVLQNTSRQINTCKSEKQLFSIFLQYAKKMSHADSIMIFKFLEDGSGKVLAQKRHPKSTIPNFKDHYFPALDVPPLARAAFGMRPLRYIPDINYKPVHLVSSGSKKYVSLMNSILRGVAPIHLEFVKNMGAHGSLTIAVNVNNKLWGLITFHTNQSLFLTSHQRGFLVLLTRLLADKIAEMIVDSEAKSHERLLRLIQVMTNESKIKDNQEINFLVKDWFKILAKVINADGYVCCYNSSYSPKKGKLPIELADKIYNRYKNDEDKRIHIINESELNEISPSLTKLDIKLLLLIKINYMNHSYVLLYRVGEVDKRLWAGDPTKHTHYKKEKGTYHPRRSFKTWVAEHENFVRPWSKTELMAAQQIQRILLERSLRYELSQKAFHDSLTGLYNRFYLEDYYESELQRSARARKPLTICMFDVDFFKKVNDIYGHEVGDKVLLRVADLLRAWCRKEDVICRFGGEEFVVLLVEASLVSAKKRCEVLRKTMEADVFEKLIPKLLPLTLSCGIASIDPSKQKISLKSLLRKADNKLYEAKENGRNQIIS